VDADFICFTDNPNIVGNGWIIDTTPYHLTHKSPLDNDTYTNSQCHNRHQFNAAKYYKQAFTNIPRLQSYDIVVWLDGTIEITYEKTGEYLLSQMDVAEGCTKYNASKCAFTEGCTKYNAIKGAFTEGCTKIIGWHHEWRHGLLSNEVAASHNDRYTSTHWNGQNQPYQDVDRQYQCYVDDGYTDAYFTNLHLHSPYACSPHLGVWITCFVAFLQKDAAVKEFIDLWYLQTLQYTTQDQIGFPYVCQKTNIIPLTLPNAEISGDCPHSCTQFYIKHSHGL
jgi:hypothetical protein